MEFVGFGFIWNATQSLFRTLFAVWCGAFSLCGCHDHFVASVRLTAEDAGVNCCDIVEDDLSAARVTEHLLP